MFVQVGDFFVLKLSQNKKDLNDVTAALFLVGFFAAGSWEKERESGAAATSLRSLLFRDDFSRGPPTVPPMRI